MTRPAILSRLHGVRRAGEGWIAFCPAHEDRTTRSLSVNVGDDGKDLLHCFVGCAFEQITAAVDMRMAGRGAATNGHHLPALTLAAFAAAKQLPEAFLRDLGVAETARGLHIIYRERDGHEAARQRTRWALVAKDGSAWTPGTGSPIPYGRWKLDEARERGELLLVEGETDTLAAWYHNIPCLGIPGADLVKTLTAADLVGIDTLRVVKEPDRGGETFVANVRDRLQALAWTGRALVVTLPVKDLHALHCEAGDRFADELQRACATAVPIAEAVVTPPVEGGGAPAEPELQHEGFDLVLAWPDATRFRLTSIRDSRDGGVRGELTVYQGVRRLSWGAVALSSVQGRATLQKRLETAAPGLPWGEYLEDAAYRLTQAAREGEPLVTLTGTIAPATREIMPRLLYEGEPTQVHADGDTGKSLFLAAVLTAAHANVGLPCGLRPVRALPAAYLDWETSEVTVNERVGLIAASLGIDPPPILYKHMRRPLVDEAPTLAAEFARRGIQAIGIDSMMFAVGGSDGAAFHEPITTFYNALRLFAPAASLVLNHVTNADARTGGPARPFGGAFAFNGPRLIWEAKRDLDVTDRTAIAFTCRKANNLARKPDPFGLEFVPGAGTITVYPMDLKDAAPQTTAGASLPWRIRTALAAKDRTSAALAEMLTVKENIIRATLSRLASADKVRETGMDGKSKTWGLCS